MTRVTLLVFSGRLNPAWELTDVETAVLARLLDRSRSAPEISTLGYRGFLIQSDDSSMPHEVIVRDAPEIEYFLLNTARALPADVFEVVERAIGHTGES